MKTVALIPARSGSLRVPNKNIRKLDGHPLIAYTIQTAIDSNMFDSIVCATDSELYKDIAQYYGAEVPFLRPSSISGDNSPDIEWVQWVLSALQSQKREFDFFSILRPTNPFRSKAFIENGFKHFTENKDQDFDSLRAVEMCKEHPGKQWVIGNNGELKPVLPFYNRDQAWHSSQYSSLPTVYTQSAALEICKTEMPLKHSSISGDKIKAYLTDTHESFDINISTDWVLAEAMLQSGDVTLSKISKVPYNK
jgi:CMP-N,N'-diacetyllegionaminic acid synthase